MTDAAEAGMVHLRLIAGAEEAPQVLRVLENSPAVASLVRLAGSSLRPPGDLILCDVAREEVSVVVSQLRRSGLGRGGSISIDAVDSVISPEARRAALASAGSPADAVIWEDVEARTSESAEFSFSFAAFMVLATLIAAIGILTGSPPRPTPGPPRRTRTGSRPGARSRNSHSTWPASWFPAPSPSRPSGSASGGGSAACGQHGRPSC